MTRHLACIAACLLTLSPKIRASFLEIELTGTLDWGVQSYGDSFGFGTTDEFNLTGQLATFRWLVDTNLLGPDFYPGDISSYWTDCGDGTCGDNPFVQTSITINGVSRAVGPSDTQLQLLEDQDGAGGDNHDGLFLRGVDSRSGGVDADYFSIYNMTELYVYDLLESIISGSDIAQLDGWSVNHVGNGGDYGFARFYFATYQCTGDGCGYTESANGGLYLSQLNLSWGDGYDGDPLPVPTPAPLALLGIGLYILARRNHTG